MNLLANIYLFSLKLIVFLVPKNFKKLFYFDIRMCFLHEYQHEFLKLPKTKTLFNEPFWWALIWGTAYFRDSL